MSRPLLEVADIVRAAGEAFIERSRQWIRWKHVKVLRAIARCRTAIVQNVRRLPLACFATEGIYMVVNYTYELMEFIVRERANAEITGAYKRAGDLYSNLKSSSEAIGYIEQRVKAIEDKETIILSNQQCIMQLPTMPQGQRTGFPTGGGRGTTGSTTKP